MKSGERMTITLEGGAPWGFRLQGGGSFPLEVAKIRKRSSAYDADLREGDLVLSINGYGTSGRSHQSAMDVVDMAGDTLVFEISRSPTGKGASKPLDPQRQPRIIPMVSGEEYAAQGVVSSARAKFCTQDGNTRTDINTDEVVMKVPGGKRVTKTVTEHRVTRFPPSVSPNRTDSPDGAYTSHSFQRTLSPAAGVSSTESQQNTGYQRTLSPAAGVSPSRSQQTSLNKSPAGWSPSLGVTPSGSHQSNLNKSPAAWSPSSGVTPSGSQQSIQAVWSPTPGVTPSGSHQTLQPGEHVSRSPNRSPLMWKPPSLSPAENRANIPQSSSQPVSLSQSKSPLMWQPKSLSPSPVAPPGSHRTPSPRQEKKQNVDEKENRDPVMLSEQAKWEARYGPANVPTFSLDNFGSNTWGGRSSKRNYIPKKVDDPRYPMFDVPKVSWHAPVAPPPEPMATQKIPPPVPPKPTAPAPSPIPFQPEEQPVAGMGYHHPGMIRPPPQPNVRPAPPPPPMPPAPGPPKFHTLPKPRAFRPGDTSTPGKDEGDHGRPDHLPVFGPKVMFMPEDDSGLPLSPDRSDHFSDISSLAKKKVFSDSAFYDDASHRYPTIDEQMSMCKKIAESLTSAANTRARGARMFAKRKRKADKWVHDQNPELYGFKSEYSSSTGDVADLHDLDSELFYDEGGVKPLFTFRIPKVAGQITQGQKMSMSKEEFERLRLVAPRVDHHAVSPNVCFSIAADLHKGGKNRGARLFQKRQARVEKFVIDETHVPKPHVETRLDQMLHSPQSGVKPTPWSAAAHGDMKAAFSARPAAPAQPVLLPRHDLTADKKPSQYQGDNYNRKIKGWQSGPAHQQQSVFREDENRPLQNGETKQDGSDQNQQWNPQARQRSPSPRDQPDGDPHAIQFGDYNRRIKAWPGQGGGASNPPAQSAAPPTYNFSAQPSYNSLPRGFSYTSPPQGMAVCDL